MDYDVLVLGGGIVGCSVAYELSKYNLNIAVIERDYDVIDDISSINASIIYDGSEAKNEDITQLEIKGQKLIEEACKKYKVKINRVGSLRIATNGDNKEIDKIEDMYKKATDRKVQDVNLIEDEKQIRDLAGLENLKANKALYSKNVSVLNPYELAIAYGEVAADNGVIFRFQEEVNNIEKTAKNFKVTTNRNKFNCKVVIDTISSNFITDVNTKQIEKDKKYVTYLIANNVGKKVNKIILNKVEPGVLLFNVPNETEDLILGIKANKVLNKKEALGYCQKLYPSLNLKNIVNMFIEKYEDSMVIDYNALDEGYIKLTGSNYSKMTLTPAIAKNIVESIAKNLNVKRKKNFIDKRREVYCFRRMNDEERNEIIKIDKRYGNIICACNQVSEGEIVDCIRRPLGARTVEGIRKRTGAGLGSCYGSYCSRKIIKILANEMGIKPTDVVQDEKNSKVWVGRIKEYNEV